MSRFHAESFEPRRLQSVSAPSHVDGAVLDFNQSKASGIFAAYKEMRAELMSSRLRLTEGGDHTSLGYWSYSAASRGRPAALYISSGSSGSAPAHFEARATLVFDSFVDGVYHGHYAFAVLRGDKDALDDTETGTFTASMGGGSYNVKGMVFDDHNADGRWQNGEKGYAGATVWADLNDNGRWDRNEPRVNAIYDGSYMLKRVQYGWNRTIRCAMPKGVELLDRSKDGIRLTAYNNGTITNMNFSGGTDAWLSGTVYRDKDHDGVFSAKDRPTGGYTVWADLNRDGRVDDNEPQAPVTYEGTFKLHGTIPAGTPVKYYVEQAVVIGPKKRAYVFLTDVARSTNVNFLLQ